MEYTVEGDKTAETIVQAVDSPSVEVAIAALSNATIDIDDTPEYLKTLVAEQIIVTRTKGDAVSSNALAIALDTHDTSAIDPLTGFSAYEFSSSSTLGKALASYTDSSQIIKDVLFLGSDVASSLGDQFEFAIAAICFNKNQNKTFYALKGQQQGKDIITSDGKIIEAKFSETKVGTKPTINTQFNMTPPTPQADKYFIFMSEGLPIHVVRSDILFRFLALAQGNIPELTITKFDAAAGQYASQHR